MDYSKVINTLNEIVVKSLTEEFQNAGHKMTGKLIDDIETDTRLMREGFIQDYLMYKYGAYQSLGVPASRIPFSPGSGAGKSLYIDALIRYVQARKGITDLKKAKSVAFAIAHVQKRVGMQIRTHGQGTGWIDKAIERIDEKLDSMFSDQITETVSLTVDTLVKRWNEKLK